MSSPNLSNEGERPLCGVCTDTPGVVCDICGNGLVPPDERRVPLSRPPVPSKGPDMRPFPMGKGPQIPWFLAEAIYEEIYAAQNGREQSLETIAKRGGFSWAEVAFMWEDKRRIGLAEMRERCRRRVRLALSTSGAAE
jgi:hypothetical protein